MTTLGRDYLDTLVKNKTLIAEKMFDTNFTVPNKKFVLSLHYNGPLSYLYVNGKQIYKFSAKVQKKSSPVSLGLISQEFTMKEAKEVALSGKVYDFSVDYRVHTEDQIKNMHHYLIKKNFVQV